MASLMLPLRRYSAGHVQLESRKCSKMRLRVRTANEAEQRQIKLVREVEVEPALSSVDIR